MFGSRRNDEALDRLEAVAHKLEVDLRKVVVEMSAAATAQRIAAEALRDASKARLAQAYDQHRSPLEREEKTNE